MDVANLSCIRSIKNQIIIFTLPLGGVFLSLKKGIWFFLEVHASRCQAVFFTSAAAGEHSDLENNSRTKRHHRMEG